MSRVVGTLNKVLSLVTILITILIIIHEPPPKPRVSGLAP